MCVCVYVSVSISVYLSVCMCVFVRAHARVCVCVCVCVCVRARAHVHVCGCLYVTIVKTHVDCTHLEYSLQTRFCTLYNFIIIISYRCSAVFEFSSGLC